MERTATVTRTEPARATIATGDGSITIPVEETLLVANELIDIWLMNRERLNKEQEVQ